MLANPMNKNVLSDLQACPWDWAVDLKFVTCSIISLNAVFISSQHSKYWTYRLSAMVYLCESLHQEFGAFF